MNIPHDRKPVIAIVGATGAVGLELIGCLERRSFPLSRLRLFASSRSAGRTLAFRGAELPVEILDEDSFAGVDIVLFSAGSGTSRRFAPLAVAAGAVGGRQQLGLPHGSGGAAGGAGDQSRGARPARRHRRQPQLRRDHLDHAAWPIHRRNPIAG